MTDPRLGTPFDQYQRYQDVRVIAELLQQQQQPDRPLSILDVGGSPVSQQFLGDFRLLAANLELEPGVVLQSDGTRLPFEPDSIDMVISVDTLEHVPEPHRQTFVEEMIRVTAGYVVITGPFANGYNEFAEETLNQYLAEVLRLHHRFLAEHLENGLPHLDACLGWLAGHTAHYTAIPSGYTQHWLPLMLIRHELDRLHHSEAALRDLDRLYNHQVYWADHRLPSYRHIVVAAKTAPNLLGQIQSKFAPPETVPTPDLNGVISLWQAVSTTRLLAQHEAEIDALRAENARLRESIRAYRSGRFIRLMALLDQLKRLLTRA